MSEADAHAPWRHCPDTIAAALSRASALAGGDEYLICDGTRTRFDQMHQFARAWARALHRIGVRKGDHVGLCIGNSREWVAGFLGLGLLGAVAVPINTRLKPAEIGFILRQSRISTLLLADRLLKIDFIEVLRTLAPAIDRALPDPALPDLVRLLVLGDDVPHGAMSAAQVLNDAQADPDPATVCAGHDPLLIQYTSGTTAFPKGAMLSQRGMLWNAYAAGHLFGLRAGASYLSARPFFHISGSTLSLLAALQHTAKLVTMARFDPGEALALAEAERCTLFSGNDTLWMMLLNHEDVGRRKLQLRGGWGAISRSVYERIVARFGASETSLAYGLSEASNIAMSAWWDKPEDKLAGLMRPHPGLQVAIADAESGRLLGAGETGEIVVRGWNTMLGYYGLENETAKAFDADGWLHTGDLGTMTPDGRLAFVGRTKDIVKVGGENVAMADVENTLHEHPEIKLAQVVGIPDARLTEVVAAFVVRLPESRLTEADLKAWCVERMAGFKVPRRIAFVDGFEGLGITASSKINKKELAAHALRIFTGNHIAP